MPGFRSGIQIPSQEVPSDEKRRGAVMTLCCLCCRRKGMDSHFDEDHIGLLCPRCHFDLVRFIRLFIDSVVMLRRIDGRVLLRVLKTLLQVGVQ